MAAICDCVATGVVKFMLSYTLAREGDTVSTASQWLPA